METKCKLIDEKLLMDEINDFYNTLYGGYNKLVDKKIDKGENMERSNKEFQDLFNSIFGRNENSYGFNVEKKDNKCIITIKIPGYSVSDIKYANINELTNKYLQDTIFYAKALNCYNYDISIGFKDGNFVQKFGVGNENKLNVNLAEISSKDGIFTIEIPVAEEKKEENIFNIKIKGV
jgi:HSP20 family molecular chaperone IbpA